MRIVRRAGLLALAVAVSVVASPVALAGASDDGKLVPASKRLGGMTGGQLIGEETRLLLELPLVENPLGQGTESCFPAGHNGNVLIVWTRPEDQRPECIVKPGTSVFLTGGYFFCDPLEAPPFFAEGEEEQRECAVEGLHTYPDFVATDAILVSIDGGTPVNIKREQYVAVSPQGTAQLPAGNILGVAPQETTFVTAAYVAMIRPLRPGVHTITVEAVGGPFAGTIVSATVIVAPSG
jgi:hypothetical protein